MDDEAHVVRRVPSWGPIAVSAALLLLAGWRLVGNDNEAMAGVVIGYVASYWLPSMGPRISGAKNGG